jgi:hypothetical protein
MTDTAPVLVFEADVPAGERRVIEVQAARSAHYTDLFVETPEGFDIDSIVVAGEEHFVCEGGAPAAAFGEGVARPAIAFGHDGHPGIMAGAQVHLGVRNVSGERRAFKARVT